PSIAARSMARANRAFKALKVFARSRAVAAFTRAVARILKASASVLMVFAAQAAAVAVAAAASRIFCVGCSVAAAVEGAVPANSSKRKIWAQRRAPDRTCTHR